jgi:hypothetical protein
MYLVRYYLTGGTQTRKVFLTLHDATTFCVYQVKTGNVHSFDLIKET